MIPIAIMTKGYTNYKSRQAYKYVGDKFSALELRSTICFAVNRPDGKCIRGKNGNMLVEFEGRKTVVVARLLRKVN